MTENAPLPAASVQPVKALAEKLNLDAPNVTGIVVHAGLIYGHDGPGTVANMIQGAVSRGAATYIGDGANTWTPVHVDDIIDLYVLALFMPVAGIFNAVSSTPFSFRDLVEAIGELTGAPAVSVSYETIAQNVEWLAQLMSSTNDAVGGKAQSTFRWTPSGVSLTEDVRAGSYTVPA
ncbi:hypothetical protein E3T19_15275 [Cryobacterium sp. TMT4-31]|nr:hypothetical protein [Cryobacterium sp. TMT4-31]TFC86342.1 hypothetical protein E3T19_15275 [Cryobacterium sp. TMT4-31]